METRTRIRSSLTFEFSYFRAVARRYLQRYDTDSEMCETVYRCSLGLGFWQAGVGGWISGPAGSDGTLCTPQFRGFLEGPSKGERRLRATARTKDNRNGSNILQFADVSQAGFLFDLDWLVCVSGFFGHASGFFGPTT